MVSKWIEHVKKYAKDNNMTYTQCLKDKKCKEEYYCNKLTTEKPVVEGESVLKDIVNPMKWGELTKAVKYGRKDYQPKMRVILKKYGDMKILKITVCRHPLSQLLMKTLDAVSFGKISSRIENQPYDKLYHLYMKLELEGTPNTISLEKNEVLNAQVNPPLKKRTECTDVQFSGELTPNMILEGGKEILKDKFFPYNAVSNNCQDFIVALMKGSNIGGPEDFEFVKQDTKTLFKNLDKTADIAKKVTDIAGIANVITQGTGMECECEMEEEETKSMEAEGEGIQKSDNYYVQSVVFDKEKWDAKKARKWLKDNGYVVKKADVTDTQIRFRQVNPKYIKDKGFNKFRTKKIGKKSGIALIIAYAKPLKK